MIEKSTLRKSLKEKLSHLTPLQHEHDSQTIATRLFDTILWKRACTIATTISKFPEVDTYPLIHHAWQTGKNVVIPKCEPTTRKMDFYQITSLNELESVYYGLLEPIPEKTVKWKPSLIDLVVVPGLGFTRNGYRIGFGGGYYDRFLKDFKGMTISLAFTEQLIENIPLESHDIPVQMIISPEGILTSNE